MAIEQRLAESIRGFHLHALSSAVALNVDLDTTLTVWAQATYDTLRRRLTGYETPLPWGDSLAATGEFLGRLWGGSHGL